MKRNIPNAAILILLAVSLILWKLDIFPVFGILGGISTFGVIIAVLMIVILYWGLTNMFYGAIFFPIAILCIIFDKPLGIEALTPWTVMIVATLLTVAAYIIFPAGNRMAMINERKYNSDDNEDHEYEYRHVSFGESSVYFHSKKLQQADLSCRFGEMSVYFEDTEVPTGEVNINCSQAFGEMNLYIPKDWNVVNKVSVSFGDCGDRASGVPGVEGGVRCIITGRVSFGEIEIIKV